MNEYSLFDPALRDRFLALLAQHGIAYVVRPDAIAGEVVGVPDDLDEAMEDTLEAAYEELMEAQRELSEAAPDARALMGVQITLRDGRPLTVRLPAQYARRLHATFSIDELRDLVTVIADNVLQPLDGPLCRKP